MQPRNRHFRVAVPPGVGDVYWCLTKLKAFKEHEGIDHIELCIQQAGPARALPWAQMVDFVDACSYFRFHPPRTALEQGYMKGGIRGVDAVMWPNAIVDRGIRLEQWLPQLPIDLGFEIRTQDMGPPRVVVYASSEAINQAWVPNLGPGYWVDLIYELNYRVGPVTVIGAHWDKSFHDRLPGLAPRPPWEPLVGNTTLPQVADILKKARVVIGVISGMTILANHFRTPTIAFCPDKHHPDFPRAWVAEDAPYMPFAASNIPSAGEVAAIAADMARP